MHTYIVHLPNKKAAKAIKALVEALGGTWEVLKEEKPEKKKKLKKAE